MKSRVRFRPIEETICCTAIVKLVSVHYDFLHFYTRKQWQANRRPPTHSLPHTPPLLSCLNTMCCVRLFSLFAPQLELPRWQTALTVIGRLSVAAGLPLTHAGHQSPANPALPSLTPNHRQEDRTTAVPSGDAQPHCRHDASLVHTAETMNTSSLGISQLESVRNRLPTSSPQPEVITNKGAEPKVYKWRQLPPTHPFFISSVNYGAGCSHSKMNWVNTESMNVSSSPISVIWAVWFTCWLSGELFLIWSREPL